MFSFSSNILSALYFLEKTQKLLYQYFSPNFNLLWPNNSNGHVLVPLWNVRKYSFICVLLKLSYGHLISSPSYNQLGITKFLCSKVTTTSFTSKLSTTSKMVICYIELLYCIICIMFLMIMNESLFYSWF